MRIECYGGGWHTEKVDKEEGVKKGGGGDGGEGKQDTEGDD